MSFSINNDPRPKERFAWIEKYRKVKPVILPVPDSAQKNSSRSGARKTEVTSGLEPYTGEWGEKQAALLLRRTLFGLKKSELDYFKSLSMNDAVEQLISASPLPDPPVNDYHLVDDGAIDPNVASGASWLEAPHAGDKEVYRVMSLKNWLIKNMIRQEATIHEKMIFFWNNLLVTKAWDVYIAKASYQYFRMLHDNALGNYKTLIKALTLDPSMLIFLNGVSNNKVAPDENYGRELQELFCIGKGPGSQYTEGDVQAAARVLTGWTINWNAYANPGTFVAQFDSNSHDTTDKQFSSFYDSKVITGKTGASGGNELDELINMIVDNEETSRYICRRLYSFFVYNDIGAATEENVIAPLAEIFRSGNYQIMPVLKALFKSAHFYDAQNFGVLIKSPADHLIGLWRCLGVTSPEPDNIQLDYQIHTGMLWHMANMGLEIGDPPNVAGWPAYYQAPQYDKSWITTDTITDRALTTDSLIYWGFWTPAMPVAADILGFVSQLEDPYDPVALIRESATLLLGLELSDTAVNNLKNILLTGQQSDTYWSTAWDIYISNPGNVEARQVVETRLKSTFRQLLQLGEYHLM